MLKLSSARCRRIALASALSVAAVACGRSGTGPSGLTPAEVGGVYEICALAFTPVQDLLPPVDVRALAMDTSPDAVRRPQLFVDNQAPDFEFEFFAPDGTLPRRPRGFFRTGAGWVELTFLNPTEASQFLLMPATVGMDFQATPRRLTFSRANHLVPRAHYAGLLRRSEEGLDPNGIRGTITGHFQVGGCG